jgi:hypothetical protein
MIDFFVRDLNLFVQDEAYSFSRSELVQVLRAKRKRLEDKNLIKDKELYVNIFEMASTLVNPRQSVTLIRKILPVDVALPHTYLPKSEIMQ